MRDNSLLSVIGIKLKLFTYFIDWKERLHEGVMAAESENETNSFDIY